MGVAKAALEAVARYLARELGPRGVRVNLVSAGPIETLAAGGIPGFSELAEVWSQTAPLAWDPRDPGPVADAACFLLSPLARAITAEILHVDGGYHAMGCASPGLDPLPVAMSGAILLTGATGFLGMDALARLIERDHEQIVVLIRAPRRPAAPASASTGCSPASTTRRPPPPRASAPCAATCSSPGSACPPPTAPG